MSKTPAVASSAVYTPIRAAGQPAAAPFVPPQPSSSPATTWATPAVVTGYPKIPQSAPPAPQVPQAPPRPPEEAVAGLIAGVRAHGHSLISSQKPWREFLHISAFSLPHSLGDAFNRSRRNFAYFRSNYMLIVIVAVLAGFFWHPWAFFALAGLIAMWYFLYFGRSSNEPIALFGRSFDDGSVLACLAGLTVIMLLFTGLGWDVVGSFLTGAVIVVGHSVLRSTDDLFLTEQEAATSNGVVAAAAGGAVLPTYVRVG